MTLSVPNSVYTSEPWPKPGGIIGISFARPVDVLTPLLNVPKSTIP